jgi:hypothetical protein
MRKPQKSSKPKRVKPTPLTTEQRLAQRKALIAAIQFQPPKDFVPAFTITALKRIRIPGIAKAMATGATQTLPYNYLPRQVQMLVAQRKVVVTALPNAPQAGLAPQQGVKGKTVASQAPIQNQSAATPPKPASN